MWVFVVGLAMVGAGVWAHRASRSRRCARTASWLLAAALVVPVAAFVAYYTHIADAIWYYEWRSWPSTDLLAPLCGFSAGMLGAAMQGSHPGAAPESTRRLASAVLTGAVLTTLALGLANARPWWRPLPLDQLQDRWMDGVCLQSTPATCGPCAAATALRQLGRDASEADLAREAATDTGGTLNWLLVRALRDRGVTARLTAPDRLDEVRPPAIIGVLLPTGVGHYVAYLGRERGRHLVGEPLVGPLRLSDEAFAERYRFERFAVELSD